MTRYLRMEGVNLASFIYDTQDLSTIRGGGLLLLNAVSIVQEALIKLAEPHSVIAVTTGASSGIFEFVPKTGTSGEDVRDRIEEKLNAADSMYRHATFVVDVVDAGKESEFASKKEELLARNRWRQMQSPSLAIPKMTGDTIYPCSVDLVRPQSVDEKHVGKNKERVSCSVHQRRQFGIDNKHGDFYRGLTRFLTGTGVTLSKEAEAAASWLGSLQTDLRFVNDLNELSSRVDYQNLHNKIAVIYADGNSFGKLQQGFDKATQMAFDQQLKAYRSTFMMELMARMQGDESWKNQGKLCIETLLWGGDEFMLVVPAWKGWETLQLFYELSAEWQFEYTMDKKPIKFNLNHSAGLVFCHHNAPIHRIKSIAHDLAEICKDVEKDNFCVKPDAWEERSPTEKKGNYFAFQVLESFDNIHGSLAKYRQRVSPIKVHHGALIVDGTKMKRIMESICTIKGDEKISRGRLHGIVKNLVSGKEADAEDNIRKLRESAGSVTQAGLENLTTQFSGSKSRWYQLSELWDYVCPGRSEGLK